jgi:heptosyltransferase-2
VNEFQHILVIQTAFTGDAILGSAILESLHERYPEAKLSYLVRKGNEGLFKGHPYLSEVLTFDKHENKWAGLFRLLRSIRKKKYDLVINLHRYASSGILAGLSRAREIRGFSSNPLSFLYSRSFAHSMNENLHEIERNFSLLEGLGTVLKMPRLYPGEEERKKVYMDPPYICLAPASVWKTKQWPTAYWSRLLQLLPKHMTPVLIGGKGDKALCEEIISQSGVKAVNAAGKYSLLESAALIAHATLTLSNDSGPVHLASAVNAPVAEIFCSTVPEFGFTPLSDRQIIIETREKLSCRPCGIHGKKECPLGHFNCGNNLSPKQVSEAIAIFF